MSDDPAGIDEVVGDLSSSPRSVPVAPTTDDVALMMNHKVLTVMEVSRILRLSRMATYEGVWSGDIPSVKVGRRILVPVAGIKAMLGEIEPPQPREDDSEAA
jgi:excisionase family DNA binding protein